MDEQAFFTEVCVHEAGHAVVALYFGAQLKELNVLPIYEESAGNCRYSIGHGVADGNHDAIGAAGEIAARLWNKKYRANWRDDVIHEGAASDRAGIKGNLKDAQLLAQEILEEHWDELHEWVDRLHAEGRVVNGIWEMDQ